MHQEVTAFFTFIAKQLKYYFSKNKLVLDVGSGDFNGTNRVFFDPSCQIHGNDVFPGRNVDLVYKTSELPFFEPTFDTIISSNCFQNDPEFKESIKKIVSILRPGGLLLFSCPTTGCPEFGTRRHVPQASFGAKAGLSKWKDYFRTLTLQDIKDAIPLNSVFSRYIICENKKSHDIFFLGIKKDPKRPDYFPEFEEFEEYTKLEEFPAKNPVLAPVSFEELTESEKKIVQEYLSIMDNKL